MANIRWLGRTAAVAQVATVTITGNDITTTYSLTHGNATISVVGQAGGVNSTAAALQEAWSASTDGRMTEVTAEVASATITLTANTAGKPFTITSGASGGAGTIGAVTAVTANASPEDANDANNYSTGSLPVNGDSLFFDGSASCGMKWNLSSLSAVTLTALSVSNAFTYDIGLAAIDTSAAPYVQYRPQYLVIGATTMNIGDTNGVGSGRIKIDNSSIATTVNLANTGAPAETNVPAFIWKGTNAANVVNQSGGSMGAAIFGGETAVIATLRVSEGTANGVQTPSMLTTAGVTLTTLNLQGGNTVINTGATTLSQFAGTLTIYGTGAYTTLKVQSGTCYYQSSGTISALTVGAGGTIDFSQDGRPKTVSAATMASGSTYLDPDAVTTLSTGVVLANCKISDVTLDLGTNRTLTPA